MHICHLNLSKYFNAPEKQMETLIENLGKNYRPYKQTLFYRAKKENRFKNDQKVSSEMRMMFHKLKMNLYERLFHLIERRELQIVELPKFPYSTIYNDKFLEMFKLCDLFHTHDKESTLFAYLLQRRLNIKYVSNIYKNYSPKGFYKKAYSKASKIVTVSNYVADNLSRKHSDFRDKLEVIYNMPTINPEKIDKGESNFLRTPFVHTIIVGMVGKLHKDKNFELAIELAKKYIKKNPNIQFIMVGDGKLDAIMREKSKNLFNFKMTGFVVNIEEYIEMFDIFLLPSKEEALGATIIDAMELGKPVIASDVGGVREVLGDTGLLFESENLESLEERLDMLLDDNILLEKLKQDKMYWLNKIHYGKDSLFFQQSRKSKERVNMFNPEKITTQYENLYREFKGE